MLYEVWLWPSSVTLLEDFLATFVEADDPLEAAFRVMRERVISHAALIEVFHGDEFLAEYQDVTCPEKEVC